MTSMQNTNVVRLYGLLEKDSSKQLCYYQVMHYHRIC